MIQQSNDQKTTTQVHAKAHMKWDHLKTLVEGKSEMQKSFLVELTLDQPLEVLGI